MKKNALSIKQTNKLLLKDNETSNYTKIDEEAYKKTPKNEVTKLKKKKKKWRPEVGKNASTKKL